MTSLLQLPLPLDVLIPCLNAAVASLIAFSLALILSRLTVWTLPARHMLLAASFAISVAAPLFVPLISRPSLWVVTRSTTVETPLPAVIGQHDEAANSEPRLVSQTATAAVAKPRLEQPAVVESVVSTPPMSAPRVNEPIIIREQQSLGVIPWGRMIGTLLCGVWLIGSTIGLIFAIMGLIRLRRWAESVTVADSPLVATIASSAATSLGLRDPVVICCSSLLPAPVTFGLLRPRIVLPTDIDVRLPPDQLRAVIQHEVAHIVRRDLWIGVLQQVSTIVYWWNPLVHLASRRLADLREQICDDIAIRELPEASTYAATLVDLAERCSHAVSVPATLGIGSSPAGQLERRIRRILSSSEIRSARLTRRGIVGISTAALLMTATILLGQVQVRSPVKSEAEKQIEPAPANPPQPPLVAPKPQSDPSPPAIAVAEPEPVEEPDPFEGYNWGTFEIPGRVVDPDGKPVAGATIFLMKFGVRVPGKKATTDAEGRFQFTAFRRQGRPGNDETEINSIKPSIVATAPGFGFGTLAPGDGVTIKMVADDPITGRITDEAGKPVAGARVRVRDVFWPRRADDPIVIQEQRREGGPATPNPEGAGLDPWLAAVRRAANMNDYLIARGLLVGLLDQLVLGNKPIVYAPLIPAVQTGVDGRFTLHGVGRERVAELYVDGVLNKASALIVVANRPLDKPILVASETPRSKELLTNASADIVVLGNPLDFALEPGRTLQGVVSDRVSGAPLAGWKVTGPAITRLEYSGFDRFFATTDKDGRYRIDSFPVMNRARFTVHVAKDRLASKPQVEQASQMEPYFGREVVLKIEPGLLPQWIDFPLSKGIWITGKVVDDATGAGLAEESIEYHVFKDNPFLKADRQAGFPPDFGGSLRTNNDGTFRIRAYPGRGIVTAGGGNDYLEAIGVGDIAGLGRDEYHETLYDTGGFSPYIRNTTIEVNIPADAKTFSCELRLKKGKSREITVVDSEGRPATPLEASGINNQIENPISQMKTNVFNITNLFPGESREVVARCVPRKLMGMAVVTEKEDGPVTLKLVPWANLTGRLVDDAGQPRTRGLRIELEDGKLPIHTLNGLNYDKQEFLIDPDGKFHIDGLVPGAKYRLQVVEGGFITLGDATEDFTLQPGESRDFGDLKVLKPKPRP